MSKLSINLKDFKHIKSDKNSTTLQHKAGHQLTIAHNALSPDMHEQLKALANIPKEDQTQPQAMEARQEKMAKGGPVPNETPSSDVQDAAIPPMADGGDPKELEPFANGGPASNEDDSGSKVQVPGTGTPSNTSTGKTPQENMQDMKTGKEQSGGIPKDSPLKTGNWSIWADGGSVTPASQAASASQKGGVPSDSPISTGDWSHIWKAEGGKVARFCAYCGGMAHGGECMAEGGRIDKINPETRLPEQVNRPENKIDYNQVRKEKRDMNIKESNQPKLPKRRMFAEGDPDIGGVKQVIPYQDENSPYSTDMTAKRNEYNDIVAGHNAGFFGDPEDFSGVGPTRRGQFGSDGQPPEQFDAKAWQQMEQERQQSKDANAAQVAQEAMNTAQYNQAAQQAGLPLKLTADVPGNQDTNGAATPQQDQGQPQPHQSQAQPQSQSDPFSAGQYNAGVNEAAKIQQEQLAKQIQERQTAIDTYKDSYAKLDQERQDHIHDIQQGYIDPNKYWQDHSKVASGIGMILAGFNPTNSPNAAIGFLNNQINRSIEAQKANLESKNNLLKANLLHFGDLHSATQMTNAMMNDTLANQMQQAALQAKNPIAKQAALGAQAQLMQQSMQFQQQLAMRQAMMRLSSMNNPGAQEQAINMISMTNPEMGKTYRDAYVHGIGLSSSLTPIPEEVKQQLTAHHKLAAADQDLQQFIVNNPKAKIPGTQAYNIANQKATILQAMIREPLLKTVYREGEQPVLDKLLKSPAGNLLSNYNTMPQLRNLLDSNMMQENNLRQTYGLPSTSAPAQQQANPNEGKTGTLKDGTRVKMVNGKWNKL